MTSLTWAVECCDDRYVAKLVDPAAKPQFEAGLTMALRLHEAGIASGAPVPTADGALTRTGGPGVLALLRWVPGRELDPRSAPDQHRWGDTLARAHRALAGADHPGLLRFHWVLPEAGHLDVAPWVRPAVAEAVADLTRLTVTDRLGSGPLHGDAAPEAFRLDVGTGRVGLIDWGSVCSGPYMYDLARAVMYAGGTRDLALAADLLDAYAAAGPLTRQEIDASLPVMLRFCWAVQADWFARRIADGDHTGIADAAENWKGLNDARAALVDV